MTPLHRDDVYFCERCGKHGTFENAKEVISVDKNDGMICAIWEGVECKICGFKLEGDIFRRGHPYFDNLLVGIGEL